MPEVKRFKSANASYAYELPERVLREVAAVSVIPQANDVEGEWLAPGDDLKINGQPCKVMAEIDRARFIELATLAGLNPRRFDTLPPDTRFFQFSTD